MASDRVETVECGARHCGTAHGYRHHGCRCEAARHANAVEHQRYLLRRSREGMLLIDATGVRRRLQALAALGWSYRNIAAASALHNSDVLRLIHANVAHKDSAAKVAAVYDRLSMRAPRPSSGTTRARQAALRKGWLPPLAWDDETIDDPAAQPLTGEPVEIDEVAVQRAISGDRPATLERAELIEAIKGCHRLGMSDPEIGERLGILPNTIQAIRARQTRSVA
jgi:hypothetical protein